MRKPVLLALSLAFLVSAQSALAAGDAGNFGTPIKSGVSVSFPDSSATFQPTPEALELLADARNAAIIYISGRTSTLRPSAADEALALRRALSARSYLVARGVSPLKIGVYDHFSNGLRKRPDSSNLQLRRADFDNDLCFFRG